MAREDVSAQVCQAHDPFPEEDPPAPTLGDEGSKGSIGGTATIKET